MNTKLNRNRISTLEPLAAVLLAAILISIPAAGQTRDMEEDANGPVPISNADTVLVSAPATGGTKGMVVGTNGVVTIFNADTDTVLFSASDRPVQQALDLWREAEG